MSQEKETKTADSMKRQDEALKSQMLAIYVDMARAEYYLKKARDSLAEYGENIPQVDAVTLKSMCDSVNSTAFSLGFIQSFIRVSVLRQLVPIQPSSPSNVFKNLNP